MIPAGYLLKHVAPRPDWLKTPHVNFIYSTSSCCSGDVVDLQSEWLFNSFGVANDPALLWRLAAKQEKSLSGAELFYYEAYEQGMDSDCFGPSEWRPFTDFEVIEGQLAVSPPTDPVHLMGFDVVIFEWQHLGCSPLSCNSMAQELVVNEYCLFETFEEAKQAVESGTFTQCEPGIYTIFAVYRVSTHC